MTNPAMTTLIIPIYFFILHDLTLAVRHNSEYPPYIPHDNITINCGFAGDISATDKRIWQGDVDSNYFPPQGQNTASMASSAAPSNLTTQVSSSAPYETARFSHFDFTYIFFLSSGQKFIRLHFSPVSYQGFDGSKALFSVKTEQYTLLRNFTPFQSTVKEFCLNVEEGKSLSITFSPNKDSVSFINGIEVISMPDNLYYSEKDEFVGEQGQSYPVGHDKAMETVHRINVGGGLVSPVNDTGMFRRWDSDDDYVTELGWSVVPDGNKHELQFSNRCPAYVAPPDVYWTARSMGYGERDFIKSYNLTWEFTVDSGFDYLVRLHFCEIVPEMNKTGDRVFFIYIANQTAESQADVIQWGGGKYAPVYKDYVVGIFDGDGGVQKKTNLSIALQANPKDVDSSYADAILNGVEILKLSNSDGNLAGSNPDRPMSPTKFAFPSNVHVTKKKSRTELAVGAVFGIVLMTVIGFLIFRRVRKVKVKRSISDSKSGATPLWGSNSFSTLNSMWTLTRDSSLPSEICRYFTLAEIKAATNGFDDALIIGVGGFGHVYKGYIDGGTVSVAIKRLKSESSQGVHEFRNEIQMLSELRHLHLVSLIGYCNEEREMILVYEYMPRGSLREHLYNSDNPSLSWKRRLEICIGAAHGLHYLHAGAKHTIIHRDVKTTNILLDEKWNAKVSDFGLSRMGPTGVSKSHVSTVVKGSLGYLDPEYYRRQQLTEKSDVYSFGVVLCEVLCARPPLMRSVEKKQMSLAEWARCSYRNGTFGEMVDKSVKGEIAAECLKKYAEIAMGCLVDNGNERPSMNDVVWGLELALKLQQSAEESKDLVEELALVNYSEDEGEFSCSWEYTSELRSSQATKTSSDEQSSDTNFSSDKSLFSQIFDPKGR